MINDDRRNELAELSKRGYQLLKENLTDRAIEAFEQILQTEPENNYALVGMGDALRKQRHYQDAIGHYTTCLEHHPGNNYALFGLADCYKATNQFNRAIDIWEEYLKHDDSNVTVLTRVADAYRKVRNLERSRELYRKVLDLDSANSYALIGLGHLHYDFREYSQALKYWKTVEESRGHRVDIRVLTSIGNCHRKLKTFEQGVTYFQRALEKQPSNFYALFGLADCYRGLNESVKSLEYWNLILEKDPRNKVILTRAGDAYRTLGEIDKAADYYRKALNIDFDTYAVLGLAIIDRNEGRVEQALASILDLIKREPQNHRLSLEAADCCERLGRPDEALEILDTWLELGIHNEGIESAARRLRERL